MAQFLLLLHSDPTEWTRMPDQERQKWYGKYMAWGAQARESGFW